MIHLVCFKQQAPPLIERSVQIRNDLYRHTPAPSSKKSQIMQTTPNSQNAIGKECLTGTTWDNILFVSECFCLWKGEIAEPRVKGYRLNKASAYTCVIYKVWNTPQLRMHTLIVTTDSKPSISLYNLDSRTYSADCIARHILQVHIKQVVHLLNDLCKPFSTVE